MENQQQPHPIKIPETCEEVKVCIENAVKELERFSSPDKIAKFLEEKKISGFKKMPAYCVLANYFRENLEGKINYISVNYYSEDFKSFKAYIQGFSAKNTGGYARVNFPNTLFEFTKKFDAGEYPNITKNLAYYVYS